MNRRVLIATLVLAASSSDHLALAPTPPPATVSRQRLTRVYVLLTHARETARGRILPAEADLIRTADAMSVETLKNECLSLVDGCLNAFSSVSNANRGEVFGYVKNAKLRLIFDREEKQGGHVAWTNQVGANKTNAATREFAQDVRKALRQ
jgi:hypothetical protein